MRLSSVLIACFALATAGCSTLSDYGTVRKEGLRNDQGHLIGYKEVLRNQRTGEVIAQVALFTPLRDANGDLVGYEERVRDGTIIHDPEGRSIGGRFTDLRSRGTNAKGRGLTIVLRPADAQQLAASRPQFWELVASLSASDLRRVQ